MIAVNKSYLVVQYLRDVKPALEIRRLSDGHFLQDIPLPIGSIEKLSGHRNDNMMFISFTTFLIPSTIYLFDFSNKTAAITVRITKKIQHIFVTWICIAGLDFKMNFFLKIFYN